MSTIGSDSEQLDESDWGGGRTVITQINRGRVSWLLQRSVQYSRELSYHVYQVRNHLLDVNSQVHVLKDYWTTIF